VLARPPRRSPEKATFPSSFAGRTLLPELGAVRGALPPCGEAVRLRFLPSAVGFVVGPELERALAVLYRAKRHMRVTFARSVCPRLAAPRTGFSRSGRMCEALAPAPATRRARSVSTCSWAVVQLHSHPRRDGQTQPRLPERRGRCCAGSATPRRHRLGILPD
jgi:hypothetical protein